MEDIFEGRYRSESRRAGTRTESNRHFPAESRIDD